MTQSVTFEVSACSCIHC